tara:strand:+ start:340 stop:1080 length:741 start_codon:yes stop_codon:yes gene_type:complete
MKNSNPIVDKVYKLNRDVAPLTFTLSSRNTARKPLMYFDGQVNRALRYARNQKTPFEDEQDGNFILEPIVFEDGFLSVPKENQVLQHFLSLHPDSGAAFSEVDKEKDAQEELDYMVLEADALAAARKMDLTEMEMVARVLLEIDPSKLSSSELKRDILILAKRYPEDFLDALEDPSMDMFGKVALFLEKNLLGLRNNGRDVHFNLKTNKKRMMSVPFGEDPKSAIAAYLKSDDGIEILKMLEKHLE